MLAVGGVRQHPVVLIDDRRHRVKELAEGEVCIYTHEDTPEEQDENGMTTKEADPHRVILKEGRIAEIRCRESSMVMDADGITLTSMGGSSIALTEDNH